MKTRSLVVVVLSLLLLISTAPPSTAHGLQLPVMTQPPNLNELTVLAGAAGSSGNPDSVPSNPSSLSCAFPGWATPYYENFDSVTPPSLPPGWATYRLNGTLAEWKTNAGTVHPLGHSASSAPNLVYFNSWSALAGETARLYRTTALYLRHYRNVHLCLRWYRDSGYSERNDRVQAQVSTNGGSSWTNVGSPLTRYYSSDGWWTTAMGIDYVVAGQPSVNLGFLGISEYGNDVHLDDIQVIAVPALGLSHLNIPRAKSRACASLRNVLA